MRGARRAPPSARRRVRSVHEFVRAQPRTASYHASGKEALRVGLSLLDRSDGDEVLVPSYAPAGVVDAVLAAGTSPRFYRVESAHEPDVASVEGAVSEETMALLAVQYFGFPQTRMDDLRRVARAHGAALVDDASHGPLGSVDGRALGTLGDVGFASFHKPLDAPDGAVLYVDDSSPVIDPVFDGLPAGACPWVFPVAVDADVRRAETLESRIDDAFGWPPLPDAVAGAAAFPTANRLSRSVVCPPLHRPSDEAHARRLIGATVA